MNKLLILMVIIFSSRLMATEVENKNKQLTGLQLKIKQTAKQVKDLKRDKRAIYKELKNLEKQSGKQAVKLNKLEQSIQFLRDKLKKNRQQSLQKQKAIGLQKQSLENQVQAAYRLGKKEKLKLMLNQQDPVLSERVMVYYDYFNNNRLQKIEKINQQLNDLDELQKSYKNESIELEEKLVIQTAEVAELLKAKAKRKKLLKTINKRFDSKKQELKEFKQNEKKLAQLIKLLQMEKVGSEFIVAANKPFARLKGKLPWPVKGRLLKKFAERRSDSRWDGVLIGAKEGREVRAVSSGKVVFADWLRGYGLLTIIKHDNGYMTLYAFNQSLYKAKGDWVEAGTVISTVGKSGGRSNAALYFGIRKKGKPVNPVKWCRKVRHGKVG